jgi:hypothetical protein
LIVAIRLKLSRRFIPGPGWGDDANAAVRIPDLYRLSLAALPGAAHRFLIVGRVDAVGADDLAVPQII